MHKLSIIAAAITAIVTLAPIPVITGTAQAQVLVRVPKPNNPTPSQERPYECTEQLGYLFRVYEEQLDQVHDVNRVWVTPVCMGDASGMMRSEGNAGALRGRIADNEAMTTALFRKKFGPEDVVAIKMIDEDTVILYVHPFRY